MRTLRDVWDGFRSRPGRAALSGGSIFLGMVALASLLGVFRGLSRKADAIMDGFGADVVAVMASTKAEPLTEDDARCLEANLPRCRVAAVRRWGGVAQAGEESLGVLAVGASMAEIRRWNLKAGRFIDAWDMTCLERHAAVSDDIAARRGWELGKTIRIGGMPFVVIGIVGQGGRGLEGAEGPPESAAGIYIPLSTGRFLLGEAGGRAAAPVDAIWIRAPGAGAVESTLRIGERVLGGAGRPPDSRRWMTADSMLGGIRALQRLLLISGGSMAVLCALLGGVVLMALMISNVRERTPEIGLRRALGAEPGDIAALFVVEGCLTAGVAAVAGVAVAWAGTGPVLERVGIPFAVDAAVLLVPLGVALLVGLAFSMWPALAASRLAPAEALRAE